MIPELDKLVNVIPLGVRELERWGSMPVYEMTAEPKCDRQARKSPESR